MKLNKENIEFCFENSKEYKTFVDPQNICVFKEHGEWFVRIEDFYFDVNDQASERTFSCHECVLINGENSICFEEL